MYEKIEFNVMNFNENCYNKTILYWESRGFSFKKKTQNTLIGNRGSMIGNLSSSDMKKIKTEIKIFISNDSCLKVEMKINTIFQVLTKTEKDFWKLELDTFQSVLINSDTKELEWLELNKNTKQEKDNIKKNLFNSIYDDLSLLLITVICCILVILLMIILKKTGVL